MPRSPSEAAAPATALETIYRRHQGLVRWVLRSRGVPEPALDDHVHDVFLAILRRLPERDPGVPMRTWVAGVARNVSFSHRRTAARERSRALRLVPPDDPPRPDEELERREAWQALHAFLDDLGPEQREVFVMVDVTGMRISELAASMGMPANTLHSRLKVARTRFSERFGEPREPRAVLLQRAREAGRADPQQRRRTWALIAAAIEGLPAVPAAGATAGASTTLAWIVGGSRTLTAVTLAVGVLGAAAVVGARSSAVEPSRGATTARGVDASGPGRSPTPGAGAEPVAEAAPIERAAMPSEDLGPALVQPREPTRARPPVSRRSAAASPAPDPAASSTATAEPADTELLRAMAAVERARDALARGRAREALAALDDPRSTFGMLERERRRLELDAACRLDDAARSRRAAAALAELGVAVDAAAPCDRPRD